MNTKTEITDDFIRYRILKLFAENKGGGTIELLWTDKILNQDRARAKSILYELASKKSEVPDIWADGNTKGTVYAIAEFGEMKYKRLRSKYGAQ